MKRLHTIVLAVLLLFALTACGRTAEPASGEKTPAATRTVTISCAGDCTLGTDVAFDGETFPVEAERHSGDYGYFFRNVKPIFDGDDLTIVNFEGTLTDRGERQDKTFAFRGKKEYTKVLTEGGVEAVTLANNHSKDYGEVSKEDTKKALSDAGIVWFENQNVAVMERNGVRIGLIGLYALDGSAEGNLQPTIQKVREQGAELIIVQVHWGIEGDAVADESQINLAHAAIDAGADLVIGHHPHVLQGLEQYKGKMIAYSLGNFCFGGNTNPSDKDTMIYRQTFTLDGQTVRKDDNWQIYPCRLSSTSERNNYQPTPATGSEKTRIAKKIQTRSDPYGDLDVLARCGEAAAATTPPNSAESLKME